MKVWVIKDCVAASARLAAGKEYDLAPQIARKLIARGYASEKMPTKKVQDKAE